MVDVETNNEQDISTGPSKRTRGNLKRKAVIPPFNFQKLKKTTNTKIEIKKEMEQSINQLE